MKRTVKEMMTRHVWVAKKSWSFKDAVRTLSSAGVSALPVVDDDGRLVGIVSEADLLLKEEGRAAGEHHPLSRRRRTERHKADGRTIAQVMTSPVATIAPDATLSAAARVMHGRGVKRLPVVGADGRVVGIVSRRDLVKVFLRSDREIRDEIVHDVIERFLWIDRSLVRVEVKDGVVSVEGRLENKTLVRFLIELAENVDGVVGVESRLSYETDDTKIRPEAWTPWGFLPPSLRYPTAQQHWR